MSELESTVGVHFEQGLHQVTPSHDTILVSLGGMKASLASTADDFQELSRRLQCKRVFAIWGEGQVGTNSAKIARNVKRVADRIRDTSNKNAKVIMVGKSMGGNKLWRATRELDELDQTVDLFVGIDVSGHIGQHHATFLRSRGDRGAKRFKGNVRQLYGFYQSGRSEAVTGERVKQTGAPLFYECSSLENMTSIPAQLDGAINVEVTQTPFDCQNLCPGDEGDPPITCSPVDHQTIDTDDELLAVVEALVSRTMDS